MARRSENEHRAQHACARAVDFMGEQVLAAAAQKRPPANALQLPRYRFHVGRYRPPQQILAPVIEQEDIHIVLGAGCGDRGPHSAVIEVLQIVDHAHDKPLGLALCSVFQFAAIRAGVEVMA